LIRVLRNKQGATNKFFLTSQPVSLRSIIKAAIEDLAPIAREKSIETEIDLGWM